MPPKNWRGVSLPAGLVAEIEAIVESRAAYTSISEFVRAAVTRRIEEIEAQEAPG